MKKATVALLSLMTLLAIWVAVASVSATITVPIRPSTGPPLVNVETILGLVPNSSAEAANNSVKLNAALKDSTYRTSFYFPGGDWHFGPDVTNASINGTCVETDDTSGYGFIGAGNWRNVNDGSVFTGPQAAQIIYAGPRLRLNTDITTSATSATPCVITVTGYTVKSQDVGATLEITGGTNAITTTGYYVIESVNTGSNTWTLDRQAVSSGTATNLTGLMTYSLWEERGFGNSYTGLHFKGNEDVTVATTLRCHLGMHVVADGQDALTGKHTFTNCSWSDFNVIALAGKDLRKAYGKPADGQLDGESDQDCHADHLHFVNTMAANAKTFLYLRNVQSVSHVIRDQIHALNIDDSFLYAERGGETLIDSITIGGSRGHVVRVGIPNSGSGNIIVRKLSQDANPESSIPRLYLRDQGNGSTTTECRVTFDGVHIDRGLMSENGGGWDAQDIIEAYSADRITLRNVEGLKPACFLMTKGGGSDPVYQPHIYLEGATLIGFSSTPSELKDAASTSPVFGYLKWRDCQNYSGSTVFADGATP